MRQRHRYYRFHWLKGRIRFGWMPLLLGIITTLAVLGLWQQLLVREQLHIQQLVQQEATAIESELNRELSTRILTLERMASRWQVSGGTPKAFWENDATNYVDHFYGYQAIEWVDSSFHVRWVVPLKGNESAQNLDLSQEHRRRITLNIARDLHQTILTRTVSLAQGGKGFLAVVPIYVDDDSSRPGAERFDGFIVGVFRFQALFDSILKTPPEYLVQISDGKGLIYSQGTPPSTVQPETKIVQTYGADWQVEVFPTPALLSKERSPLPNLILGSGLLSSWALALMVYLGQRAKQSVRQARKINQQLQAEIAERQRIETELREMAEVMEYAISGISKLDTQGRYLYVNKAYADTTGYLSEDMIGMGWQGTVHPDDLEPVSNAYQQMVQNGKVEVEAKGIRKDGSSFYKQLVMISTYDKQQQFAGHYCFLKDISDRKQAEAALRQSESTLRSFFNSEAMLMGIAELHDHDILHLTDNQTTASFFGTTPEAMKNRFASEMGVSQSYLQRWIQAYQEAARIQSPVHFEYLHEAPSGQRWLAATVCQIAGHSSHYPRFSYIVEDITKRKQIELALENELMRSQMLFNTSIDGIVILNHQGNVVQTSSSFAQMLGYTVEEILTLNIVDWDAQWDAAELQQILQGTFYLPNLFETCHRRKDRSLYDVEISYSRAELDGEIMHFCICRDISERKQAESAIAHLAAIIESSEDAIISKSLDGKITSWNAAAEKLFGYTAAEIVEQPITLLMPEGRLSEEQRILAHIHRGESITPYDAQRQRKDGTLVDLSISVSPIKNAAGQVIGASKIARDIRDRKQAEIELKHQKDMLQVIVNYIPVMIALFNAEGRIEFVNPEFERVLGWSLADWQQGDVLLKCYPDPADYKTVIEHMVAVNGSWKDFTTLTKTGQAIETSWTNVQLSNGANLGIGQDISDRKRKETVLQQAMEAAEAANLAKSMFLANMSHELRTPLNVILGFAQVMTHDSSLTPSQREDLQTIQRSGDHLLSLINDVLDLSKIEAGHCVLEENGFDLIAMLHGLRTMMTERARDKRLQLRFDIAPDVPQFVIADEQKLRQILLNLLSNAIKFTDRGSITLRVTSREAQNRTCPMLSPYPDQQELNSTGSHFASWLQLEVADTGIGIAAAELDTVFDAFVQAEAGRKSISGTGLGLTISRRLLELMHGTIAVQSVPNVGSTFTATVPVCPTVGTDIQAEERDRTVIGLAPGQLHRRILVVDDQRENRLVIVRLLAQLGLAVREAANGQEAIQIWQEWRPDLTWMDIRMPDMDGYETTRQIRALEQNQTSIIIALTAQASGSDRALAMMAGCNDYISKPFREKTIFLKLAEYLGLEYVYANSSPLPSKPTAPANLSPDPSLALADLTSLPTLDRSTLPPAWLSELEEAAACGNDRAIIALVAQLPPELADLADSLIHLANQCQFEQILHALGHPASQLT